MNISLSDTHMSTSRDLSLELFAFFMDEYAISPRWGTWLASDDVGRG